MVSIFVIITILGVVAQDASFLLAIIVKFFVQKLLKSRAVLSGEIGDITAVDPEEHLRGGVAHLTSNPFRTLPCCQPKGGCSVAGLVGAA